MRKVFAIGQSVFDILFKDGKPFSAKVGGSMLNTTISLARLGIDVYFIGEYGHDLAGDITHEFLQKNGVNNDYAYRFQNGQTTISLAFLQENGDAAYNFYRKMPEKRLDIDFPQVTENDIILYGSFYIFDKRVEEKIMPFLQDAKRKGATLYYDPNFRKPHYDRIDELRPTLMKYMEMADVVRGSDEDFMGIFNVDNFGELLNVFSQDEKLLIYTAAQNGVFVKHFDNRYQFEVPKIKPVSTIGAGDTFNAGVIYGLIKNNIGANYKNNLNKSMDDIIARSIDFSKHVCMSEDNYLSEEMAGEHVL